MIGKRLGKYKILRLLGQGGMGAVYLGQDVVLDRLVAIKILPEVATKDKELVQRFALEARAAAKLAHSNIVGVYDFGQAGSIYYLVLEFIEGKSLVQLVRERGPLPLKEALFILGEALKALDKAHQEGVVHRDIKPDNIMISRSGEVKVMDFGIAKMKNEAAKLTITGQIMGTPHYMSPEQCLGEPVDHRSDIYSMGITFYYMLVGQPPFQAESALAILNKHVYNPLPDVQKVRSDLPESVVQILEKMTAKKREERFQSVREILQELAQLPELAHLSTVYSTLTPPPAPTDRLSVKSLPHWVLVGVGILLLVLFVALTKGNSEQRRETDTGDKKVSTTQQSATGTPSRPKPPTTGEKPPVRPTVAASSTTVKPVQVRTPLYYFPSDWEHFFSLRYDKLIPFSTLYDKLSQKLSLFLSPLVTQEESSSKLAFLQGIIYQKEGEEQTALTFLFLSPPKISWEKLPHGKLAGIKVYYFRPVGAQSMWVGFQRGCALFFLPLTLAKKLLPQLKSLPPHFPPPSTVRALPRYPILVRGKASLIPYFRKSLHQLPEDFRPGLQYIETAELLAFQTKPHIISFAAQFPQASPHWFFPIVRPQFRPLKAAYLVYWIAMGDKDVAKENVLKRLEKAWKVPLREHLMPYSIRALAAYELKIPFYYFIPEEKHLVRATVLEVLGNGRDLRRLLRRICGGDTGVILPPTEEHQGKVWIRQGDGIIGVYAKKQSRLFFITLIHDLKSNGGFFRKTDSLYQRFRYTQYFLISALLGECQPLPKTLTSGRWSLFVYAPRRKNWAGYVWTPKKFQVTLSTHKDLASSLAKVLFSEEE